jgi:hypothetical protein
MPARGKIDISHLIFFYATVEKDELGGAWRSPLRRRIQGGMVTAEVLMAIEAWFSHEGLGEVGV